VTNEALLLADVARQTLRDRLNFGDPPDLFQANIGHDLLQWTEGTPRLEALNALAQSSGWTFYDELLRPGNLSDASGNLVAFPVDIVRINSLFVNLPILQRNGVDPASLTTLSGLHAALETLSHDPQLIAPINIGAIGQWTLDILILDTILPAVAGGPSYEDYFRGNRAPDDPMIGAMLDEAATLWQYMPVGANAPTAVDWVPAIEQFMAGNVAMTVMGDWTKGMLDADGRLTPGVGYDDIPFPSASGVTGTFVYTADSFAMPIGAPSRALAIDFLGTFVSDDGQVAFNALHGSTPTRVLPAAALARFDPVAQRKIRAFETAADRRVALSTTQSPEFYGPISQALFDFASTCEAGACDQTVVVSALAANYALLGQ
jgi:ABC-type glycerol-3-phosphate transport system substrate-binding protein